MSDEGYNMALGKIANAARKKATRLDLNGLGLSELPPELFKLTSLSVLILSFNRIVTIPDAIRKLSNLTQLALFGNEIGTLPDALGDLQKLKILNLGFNKLGSYEVASLDALRNLQNLRRLILNRNNFRELPEVLGSIDNLKALYLDNNQIEELPTWLGSQKKLEELYLHGNRGLGIPAEVLGPTWQEASLGPDIAAARPGDILEYYFRTKKKESPLNEAKLILVGRGGAGKTSVARRLIFRRFNPQETKTEGINIDQWTVPVGREQVRLNVWDFGGQEILHATHQFFLTERSLYLLVLNGRDGGEDAEAEYWLKLIGSFGGNSPVIIVLNKCNEHAFDLNRTLLQKKYPNIRRFVRTDCKDNTGIKELKAAICKATSDIDELRVNFPADWSAVKDLLASWKKNYLGFARYRELCAHNGVKDPKDQELLARVLHQLGIVLNYKDDDRLKDTHVLNPHWVTKGIYKILNSKKLEKNHGKIRLGDISGVLPKGDYPPEMVCFIFDLMKKFDLCFSFQDDDLHYLVPELLPKNDPAAAGSFNPEKCLNFQYHYTVLPEGILPRFITRTHHLNGSGTWWRSGAILQFQGCRALVKADSGEKKVVISIDGNSAESRRRLLAVIRTEFERIHREIKNLDQQEMVPLPGLPEELIPYTELLVRESQGILNVDKVVGREVKTYEVSDLLSRVDLPGYKGDLPGDKTEERTEKEGVTVLSSYSHKDERYKNELETHLKISQRQEGISVFFSYAHEDERHKDQLASHLNFLKRQNKIKIWNDREIKAGEGWEGEIMKRIESADFILLLISASFMTSDFCYDTELKRALERHEKGEAIAIPIIVRDCNWPKANFAKLQVLPKDGKAVNTWANKDTAWRNVAEEIERAVDNFRRTDDSSES